MYKEKIEICIQRMRFNDIALIWIFCFVLVMYMYELTNRPGMYNLVLIFNFGIWTRKESDRWICLFFSALNMGLVNLEMLCYVTMKNTRLFLGKDYRYL